MNWFKKYQSNQNPVNLWLDDVRDPSDPKIQELFGSTGNEIWVKTPQEAIKRLENGNISSISFDHDLGGELTGIEVANWIEEAAHDKKIPKLSWRVHSQNPIGNKNIVRIMESADRFWDTDYKDASTNNTIKLSQDYQIYSVQDSIQNREDLAPSLLRKKKKTIKTIKKANRVIRITQDDYDKVKIIIEKIILGNNNWSNEDLQLQANYPEVVEKLLRDKAKN